MRIQDINSFAYVRAYMREKDYEYESNWFGATGFFKSSYPDNRRVFSGPESEFIKYGKDFVLFITGEQEPENFWANGPIHTQYYSSPEPKRKPIKYTIRMLLQNGEIATLNDFCELALPDAKRLLNSEELLQVAINRLNGVV